MNDFIQLIKNIVEDANKLKDLHLKNFGVNAPVNYACIFAQNDFEYEELFKRACNIGKVIRETTNGNLFLISIETVAGTLKILKIRKPDITRSERGDADFTIIDTNYTEFKDVYLKKEGFKLIQKEDFEMVELMDKKFNVRAYFSNPTIGKTLGIE